VWDGLTLRLGDLVGLTLQARPVIDNENHLHMEAMSEREERSTVKAAACAYAVHAGCPHAGSARLRSRWLQVTCAFACRCTERYRALLVCAGSAGIAGFCAASLGFFLGLLNEAQYLAAVAGSLSLFAVSVSIVRLGDPYELKRMECQRTFALHTLTVRPMPRVEPRSIARPPRAAMN
jgi:hypothetical protein